MTKNLKDMTQEEFNQRMAEIKERQPKLYQLIVDFVHKRFTSKEADEFIRMTHEEREQFIENYQARA
ncbi:hypothetical protein ACVV62_01760 [Streptococcus pluranimalium]